MRNRFTCKVCQNEIAHPGAECPYCKSRSLITEGASPRILATVFVVLVGCFVFTTLVAGNFKSTKQDRAATHIEMANTLMEKDRFEDAIEHFRDALLQVQTDSDYRLGLAEALYEVGKYPESENHLRQLLVERPTSGVANHRLAQLAEADGRWDDAAIYYRTAVYGQWDVNDEVRIDEQRRAVRLELIAVLERSGRDEELATELQELSNNDPENREVRHRLARQWLKIEAYTRATEQFRVLLRLDPNDLDAATGRAESEFYLGNYLTARTYYRRAARQSSDETIRARIALCDRIVRLNPTQRGVHLTDRYSRSRKVMRQVLDNRAACRNPLGDALVGPLPPLDLGLQEAFDKVNYALAHTRRQATEEAVEANILLATELWSKSRPLCADRQPDNEALELVMAKLSR